MPKRSVPSLGIWSTSSPVEATPAREGLKLLTKEGFRLVIPKVTRAHMSKRESTTRKFLAGPDELKVQALRELWRDESVRNIMGTRGGYGCLRLLKLLDEVNLPRRDKRIWGFSDLTVIQHYFYGRFGLPWVHSPMIASTSLRKPVPVETRAWRSVFSGETGSARHALRVLHDPKAGKLAGRTHSAPMIGGNLACFVSLLGTPWEPVMPRPFFLFLEDLNEPAYKVDRLLHQLEAAQFMSRCRGVVLGHFTDSPGAVGVIKLWAKEANLPLVAGLKVGHETPNLPLPMGVEVRLDAQKSGGASLQVPIPSLR